MARPTSTLQDSGRATGVGEAGSRDSGHCVDAPVPMIPAPPLRDRMEGLAEVLPVNEILVGDVLGDSYWDGRPCDISDKLPEDCSGDGSFLTSPCDEHLGASCSHSVRNGTEPFPGSNDDGVDRSLERKDLLRPYHDSGGSGCQLPTAQSYPAILDSEQADDVSLRHRVDVSESTTHASFQHDPAASAPLTKDVASPLVIRSSCDDAQLSSCKSCLNYSMFSHLLKTKDLMGMPWRLDFSEYAEIARRRISKVRVS